MNRKTRTLKEMQAASEWLRKRYSTRGVETRITILHPGDKARDGEYHVTFETGGARHGMGVATRVLMRYFHTEFIEGTYPQTTLSKPTRMQLDRLVDGLISDVNRRESEQ